MRAPLLRFAPSSDSWLTRIRENFGQLLIPADLRASSANGAPIHLLKFEKTKRSRRAQGASLVMHVAVVAAIVLALTQTAKMPMGPSIPVSATLPSPLRVLRDLAARPFDGGGKGGDKNPIPATHGDLPPRSSIQLIRPSLPQNENHELPVPPTILDANAPPVLISIDRIGLPWMPDETKSPGPGERHGIGSRPGDTMGDDGRDGVGRRDAGDYVGSGSTPSCVYCPLPVYTDEARHVKMQGTVTLRVLVGADGRATDIRVVRGIGYGLEERAMQTVRGWKFNPAHDTNRRPGAAWVTIEVVFRLF